MAQPQTQFTFNLGSTTTTAAAPALNFGSGGGITSGFSLGSTVSSASSTTVSTSTGLSLGSLPSSTAGGSSFNFPASSQPQSSFSFGTAPSTGTQPLAAAVQPNNKKVTFNLPTATATPLGITPSPASSVAPTNITAGVTATGPSVTFTELEEDLNKWQIMIDELQRPFYSKVQELNATDTLLYENKIRLEKLNTSTDQVSANQRALNEELNFVGQQQKELDEIVTSLEKQIENIEADIPTDTERTHIYKLADSLDLQIRKMTEELSQIVDSINEQNQSQDTTDPIVQTGKILNTQINTLIQLDQSAKSLAKDLETIRNFQTKL